MNGQSANEVLANLAAHGFTYRLIGGRGGVTIAVYRKGVKDYVAAGDDVDRCVQAMLDVMRAAIAAKQAPRSDAPTRRGRPRKVK